MRELIDHHAIANQARMLRSADRQSVIVIAEDDAASRVLKTAVVDPYAVMIIVGHRKENVRRALALFTEPLTIGIVDADFERLEGLRSDSRCFWFDHRDLEIMLICSKAFDRVVDELTSGREDPAVLREHALEESSVIGRCRANSAICGLRLVFDGIQPDQFYDVAEGRVDEDSVLDWLLETNTRLPERHVLLAGTEADLRLINRGHDVSAIIAAILRNRYELAIGAAQFEQWLRVSVRREDLDDCELVRELREWESMNSVVIVA